MLASLLRSLGVLALVGLLLVVGGVVVFVARSLLYTQHDDPGALARKQGELAWMKEQARRGTSPSVRPPNVVLILFDDLGYGDLGAYGSRAVATPQIDALAREGAVFETFYAPAPYCTPSRAGFLTGRWPIRTGLTQVVFPRGDAVDHVQRASGGPIRLPADEILLPEALEAAGYATGMVGKWHLGDASPSLPNDLGFDAYFGVLHSNDMRPLPLWRDREVVDPDPIDQRQLTPRYTDEAIAFIEGHRDAPFFLYVAHSFPHVPLHATPEQAGRSDAGLYGDVLADLDASVGRLVDALQRLELANETLVLITSDNGPWFQGSPGPVRGRKNDVFEGGMRVPFIAWWPGRIASRRVKDIAAGVDVLPTALALAGVPLPRDRTIDGVDLGPLLFAATPDEAGTGADEAPRADAKLPERPIYSLSGDTIAAIRVGRWKLHARHGVFGGAPWSLPFAPLFEQGPWLFDLERDPDESYDVHERFAEPFARLDAIRDAFERERIRNPRGFHESARLP
ncbi:MAG: sulfatase [Myxococcota bacterium]